LTRFNRAMEFLVAMYLLIPFPCCFTVGRFAIVVYVIVRFDFTENVIRTLCCRNAVIYSNIVVTYRGLHEESISCAHCVFLGKPTKMTPILVLCHCSSRKMSQRRKSLLLCKNWMLATQVKRFFFEDESMPAGMSQTPTITNCYHTHC